MKGREHFYFTSQLALIRVASRQVRFDSNRKARSSINQCGQKKNRNPRLITKVTLFCISQIAHINCQIGAFIPIQSVGLERESIMSDLYLGPQERPGAVSPMILLPVWLA